MSFWDKTVDKTSDLVLYNPTLKKITVPILDSRLVVSNPLYWHFHKKQMEHLIAKCQNAPLVVMIENTNACNARCSFCPHSKMKRKVGIMDFDLYKGIIDECAELGINHVDIHQFGEPLLDPLFSERVAYANLRGIQSVSTNTNASLLDKEMAIEILNAGLDQIIISLDAASKKVYSKIRPPLDFSVVENNVSNLVKLRNARGLLKPKVILDFVQTKINEFEVEKYVSKWKNAVDAICISYMHNWASSIGEDTPQKFHGRAKRREPCRLLWTDLVISWDGRVPLCCIDYENEVMVGDIQKESIREVWTGEKLKHMRETHLSREFDRTPLCTRCEYRSTWWISK